MEQLGILATQFGLQLQQQFSGDARQLSIDSEPYAAVPSFTGQLHDAGSTRAHASQVHDARDATTGYFFPSFTIAWTPIAELPV